LKDKVHVIVEKKLMETIREVLPETKGLTYSGALDVFIRKALKNFEKVGEKIEG